MIPADQQLPALCIAAAAILVCMDGFGGAMKTDSDAAPLYALAAAFVFVIALFGLAAAPA